MNIVYEDNGQLGIIATTAEGIEKHGDIDTLARSIVPDGIEYHIIESFPDSSKRSWKLENGKIVTDQNKLKAIKLSELKTQAEKAIVDTIAQYDMEIGTVHGWANSEGCALQVIAQKLQAWRAERVNQMFEIRDQVLAGELDVDSINFDAVWVEFEE